MKIISQPNSLNVNLAYANPCLDPLLVLPSGHMWEMVYERPEGPFDICYSISGAYTPRRVREMERERIRDFLRSSLVILLFYCGNRIEPTPNIPPFNHTTVYHRCQVLPFSIN